MPNSLDLKKVNNVFVSSALINANMAIICNITNIYLVDYRVIA